jgi:hypothetical protein
MKVRVQLYGTLSRRVAGYRHAQGIEIELPEGATVNELLALLKISESQGPWLRLTAAYKKRTIKFRAGSMQGSSNPCMGGDCHNCVQGPSCLA